MVGLAVLNFFVSLDLRILRFFNVDVADPRLDSFWLFVTQMHKQPLISFGVVPVLVGAAVYIYRWEAVKVLVAVGIAIALADTIAYRGIKQFIERPRPFENPVTATWLRKIGTAHGPSFPSNHTANTFAAAVVLSWYFRRGRALFYTLAIAVAISRVALGVHYPSDVFAGMILGYIVGLLVTSELGKQMRVSKKAGESWDWRSRSKRLARD